MAIVPDCVRNCLSWRCLRSDTTQLPSSTCSSNSESTNEGTLEISRWSLRFNDVRSEDAFVRSRKQQLSRNIERACFLVIALIVLLLIIIFSSVWNHPNSTVRSFERKKVVLLISVICLVFLTGMCNRTLCLSDTSREILVVTASVLVITALVCVDSWYLYRLYGIDPSPDLMPGNVDWTDSKVLLVLDGVITLTHLMLPVRWLTMVPLEVAVLLLYSGCLTLGSPEKQSGYFNLILLASLVVMAALGKRTAEYLERLAFWKLVCEKRLRFQSDFKLEMLHDPKIARVVDARSDTTSKIFDATEELVPEALHSKLEEIAVVGHAEQWLIDGTDLRISRDCVLGAGGFGVVVGGFFCEKPVAVKISRQLDTYVPWRNIVDISNEVRVLRRVRHPNIVLFYGAYVDSQTGDLALILERIGGELLSAYISKRPFDERISSSTNVTSIKSLWQLSSSLCQALIYLHSRKPAIVHGDLKPANIVVETSDLGPRLKLLDFGLSRILSVGTKPRGRTVAWAPHEVLLNPRDIARTSSDVFACGCILFFLLTSRTPRETQTRHQVINAARRGEEIPLKWPSNCPFVEECRPLVVQCLQPKREARPEIQDVFEQLVQIMSPPKYRSIRGERPSAEVLQSVRQMCHHGQFKLVDEVESRQHREIVVQLHDDILNEMASPRENVNIPVEGSLKWLQAIVVDCDVSDDRVPIKSCTVSYSPLSAVPSTLALNLPEWLNEWMSSECFSSLVNAMQSFVNTTTNGLTPYPLGANRIVFTSVLQSKISHSFKYHFVGTAYFYEIVEHLSRSSSDLDRANFSVRVVFTNFSFLNTTTSATRMGDAKDADFKPLAGGQFCDTVDL